MKNTDWKYGRTAFGHKFNRVIVTKSGYHVFLSGGMLKDIRKQTNSLLKLAKRCIQTDVNFPALCDIDTYKKEADRLTKITKQLLNAKTDWESILSVAEDGKLPYGESILIADSLCWYPSEKNPNGKYAGCDTLQLALIPIYTDPEKWMYGICKNNAVGLVFGASDILQIQKDPVIPYGKDQL